MNHTGLKSLDKIASSPRVGQRGIWAEPDQYGRIGNGYWLDLAPGWQSVDETHVLHAWTVKDLLQEFSSVIPCDCAECKNADK